MIDPVKKAGARFPFVDGDLVIWEAETRHKCARYLYVPLHDIDPSPGYPAKKLAPIDTPAPYLRYCRQLIAASSELIPIWAFGIEVVSFDRDRCGGAFIRFAPNKSLPITATDSNGRPIAWHSSPIDHPYHVSCRTDVADLVEARIFAAKKIARAA